MSRPPLHSSAVAVLGLATLASCSSNSAAVRAPAPRPAHLTTIGFDDARTGAPSGWRVGTANAAGRPDAVWNVEADASAPSAPHVLSLVDPGELGGRVYNLCWTPGVSLVDVDVTVVVRANRGEEDRGGGPAWRIGGASDYYLARWNPLEDNFRVYSVTAGNRVELASATVRADPRAWHTIRARHVGETITCWFDGEELLHASDAKIAGPGAVGVWTKADAATSFDDLAFGEPAK